MMSFWVKNRRYYDIFLPLIRTLSLKVVDFVRRSINNISTYMFLWWRFGGGYACEMVQRTMKRWEYQCHLFGHSEAKKLVQAMEVEKGLKQMHPKTALSPDGMPPLFYQHFWPTVRETVICNTLNFLNHGMAPPKLHETHIVLIPKTKDPIRVTDYWPISLCNMAYKLASKVMANRMKVVL